MNETPGATDAVGPATDGVAGTASAARVAALIRRGATLALGLGLAAALLVFTVRSATPSTWTATATLLLASPQAGLESLGIVTPPPVDPNAYRTLILDGPVLGRVLEALGTPPTPQAERELREQVGVTVESQQISSIIRVDVRDRNNERAATIANLIAEDVLSWDRERGRQGLTAGIAALDLSVRQLEAQLAEQRAAGVSTELTQQLLTQQRAELAGARSLLETIVVAPLIDILRLAQPATEADARRALTYAAVAFLLTAALVYGVLAAQTLLSRRVRSPAEAQAVTALPLYARFPGAGRSDLDRAERDAADIMRENLLSGRDPGRQPVVLLVTSAWSTRERGTVAASLAESFGRAGHRTLLIDADLRRPTSGDAFGLRGGEFASLESYLLDPEKRLEFVAARRDGSRVFSLMPSFRPVEWPADLLRANLGALVETWQRRFKVIIIESAPVLPYPDTLGIARLADDAVLVARIGESDPDQLAQAADSLRKLQIRGAGLALVDASSLTWRLGLRRDATPLSDRYAISVLRARETVDSGERPGSGLDDAEAATV